jgi:hypothetical protein
MGREADRQGEGRDPWNAHQCNRNPKSQTRNPKQIQKSKSQKGPPSQDATRVHHVFRLTDADAGRVLAGTVEIHTLELGKYNVTESELRTASTLDCWLFWLLHAHEYEPEALAKLLPQPAIRQATETLARIAEITEDKAMYDARERAIRDRKSEIYAAIREGEIKGKIETIQMLQGILRLTVSEEQVTPRNCRVTPTHCSICSRNSPWKQVLA